MSQSEENNNEDNELANLEYEQMTEQQKKIFDRRMSVDNLVAYKTEQQIADDIGVNRRTIIRDIKWLKKYIYRQRVDDLVQYGFSYDILKTKRRLDDKLLKMYRMEEQMNGVNGEDPTIADLENLLPLWKMQNDTESLLNNIVGEGPTLAGLKKAVEKNAN